MKIAKFVLPAIAAGFMATSAMGALTPNNDIASLEAGTVSNTWSIDTDTDFLSAVLLVELTAGSTHDPFTAFGFAADGALGGQPADTFVTANGNVGTIIAGGAGDLDTFKQITVGDLPTDAELTQDFIGIAWGSPGASANDIGNGLPLGRISFSDDAQGFWSLLVATEGDRVVFSGIVENGAMIPEPASMALLGLGGLAVLRRR